MTEFNKGAAADTGDGVIRMGTDGSVRFVDDEPAPQPVRQAQAAYQTPQEAQAAPAQAEPFSANAAPQPRPADAPASRAPLQAAASYAQAPTSQSGAGSAVMQRIIDNIETVIVGKRESVELVVCALVAGGHVLIEDMPGTGKTSMVSALAKSIDCGFRRIQFTPDVMPSDISGFSIVNQKTREFEFRPGAVMTNIVLADEINRASAKTQSAMLEAMEERQVTVDGVTHRLAEPFMVLATQNPIEQYGTYPLPEAQLDRFLIKLSMGYLNMDEEVRAILNSDDAKEAMRPVAAGADVLALREQAKAVTIAPAVAQYAVLLTSATRSSHECLFGASPRGSKSLVALARAYALLRGRSYVSPDDIKYLAPYVLAHRIALTHEAKMEQRKTEDVIASLLDSVAVPTMSAAEAKGL